MKVQNRMKLIFLVNYCENNQKVVRIYVKVKENIV